MNNIDSQINDRMNTYAGNPQALQQRYAQTQELVDLLALQKMKNDRAAATNAVQGAMQTDTNTYKGQLEQEAMQGARNDVLRSMAPGIQQQGQRMAQMQNRAAVGMPTTGLPAQPAPNMRGMAMGGIVGYAEGGQPMMGPPEPNLYQRMGQGLKNYGTNAQESMDILRAAKAGIGVPYENRSAAIQQVRGQIAAEKQNRDPNFIQRMGQKLMNAGLNVEESKSILKKFYDTFGKTYEEMSNGMAMGGEVKRYQDGGLAALADDESRFGIEDSGLTPEEARELDERRRDVGMVYGPFDIARDIRDIIGDLPAPQRIPREALLRRDMIDMTGAMAPSIQERRQADIERQISELPPEDRMPRRKQELPQNEGITAGMYDMRSSMPTDRQKLGSMIGAPSAVLRDNMAERAEEKPKSEIDFRALREFLTAGGGQTSTAGALGAGARGLGAYQAAEQGRQDKINQAAAELQLKRDLAVNEARMLTQKLMADYEGKITTAEIKVAQEALERLDDPLNQEYQSQVKAIREQFARQPIEMENALNRLREAHVQRAVGNVRKGVGLGGAPTTSAAITDMGLE